MQDAPDYASAHPVTHPGNIAVKRRRTRAVVGDSLWLAVLAIFALVNVLAISGLWIRWISEALTWPSYLLQVNRVPLSKWFIDLTLGVGTMIVPLALLMIAVVLSIIAAAITPVSIARRILGPIVLIAALIPTWNGLASIQRGLRVAVAEEFVIGALLLALGLTIAVLAAWIGMGSRAGGLAAVPIVAFVTVLGPLVALGVLSFADEGTSFILGDGPARTVMSLHWLQSAVVVLSTALAGFLLVRSATYRR